MFRISKSILERVTAERLSYEDFLLLKIQAPRDEPKDITDVIFLLKGIEQDEFNWDVLFDEMLAQLEENLECTKAEVVLRRVVEIGYKLEMIKELEPTLIPDSVMTQTWEIYEYFASL